MNKKSILITIFLIFFSLIGLLAFHQSYLEKSDLIYLLYSLGLGFYVYTKGIHIKQSFVLPILFLLLMPSISINPIITLLGFGIFHLFLCDQLDKKSSLYVVTIFPLLILSESLFINSELIYMSSLVALYVAMVVYKAISIDSFDAKTQRYIEYFFSIYALKKYFEYNWGSYLSAEYVFLLLGIALFIYRYRLLAGLFLSLAIISVLPSKAEYKYALVLFSYESAFSLVPFILLFFVSAAKFPLMIVEHFGKLCLSSFFAGFTYRHLFTRQLYKLRYLLYLLPGIFFIAYVLFINYPYSFSLYFQQEKLYIPSTMVLFTALISSWLMKKNLYDRMNPYLHPSFLKETKREHLKEENIFSKTMIMTYKNYEGGANYIIKFFTLFIIMVLLGAITWLGQIN